MVLGIWHYWEQPQVVVLSWVLNVVTQPLAQGTIPKYKPVGGQREQLQESLFAATCLFDSSDRSGKRTLYSSTVNQVVSLK